MWYDSTLKIIPELNKKIQSTHIKSYLRDEMYHLIMDLNQKRSAIDIEIYMKWTYGRC